MALSGRALETHVVSNLQGRARQSLRTVLVNFDAWLQSTPRATHPNALPDPTLRAPVQRFR